jgi:hypothetical protein
MRRPDEVGERRFVSFVAPGVSPVEPNIAELVDELVLCQYDRGAPLSVVK